MEVIPQKETIEITGAQALLVEQLAINGWKAGWLRDPSDAAALEDLREKIKKAFAIPLEVKP